MRRKNKNRILENVSITGIADKGKAVGRHENKVVFVEGAVPGDVVDVIVRREKSGFFQGLVKEFKSKSPDRIEPVCSHFGVCGGCKWQDLAYSAQLKHKQLTVEAALSRIAGIDIDEIKPIIGAEKTEYYRNKLEFSFSNKRWLTVDELNSEKVFSNRNALGFHRPGAFDKIVDIDKCYLQGDPSNDIRNAVRKYALENELSFFDLRAQEGLLRQLFVRISSIGEVMVLVCFFYDDPVQRTGLLNFLKENFPQIDSLQYIINEKKNDTIFDQEIIPWHGQSFIYESLGHLKFKIGPKSFFQTNTSQALKLYNTAADFADLKGDELVYDLYTGIGSIACFVAGHCREVIGIEEIEAAIDDAKENAALNGLSNTRFFAGDVREILNEEFLKTYGKPDVLITDPPRAGMHKDVLDTLLKIRASKIVYISCNPSTQARDIGLLLPDYKVIRIQPVDMFPHTSHVENVVLLKLKD